MLKTVLSGSITAGAIAIGLRALAFALPEESHPPTFVGNASTHSEALMIHAVSGGIALIVGPCQFSSWFRAKFPAVHRYIGWNYLSLTWIASAAALWLAPSAELPTRTTAAFRILALLWASTGFVAVRYAVKRDLRSHKNWMLRNYALTLSAVTLRVGHVLLDAAGVPFSVSYPIVAWGSWIFNGIIAELWLRRKIILKK